jgi:hypothetical protein
MPIGRPISFGTFATAELIRGRGTASGHFTQPLQMLQLRIPRNFRGIRIGCRIEREMADNEPCHWIVDLVH